MGHFFYTCRAQETSRFQQLSSSQNSTQEWTTLIPQGAEPSAQGKSLVLPVPPSTFNHSQPTGLLGQLSGRISQLFAPSTEQQAQKYADFFSAQSPQALVIEAGSYPPNEGVFAMIQGARLAGVPKVILEVTGLQGRPTGQTDMDLDEQANQHLSNVLVPSAALKKQLIDKRRLDPDLIEVIPPSFDEDRLLKEKPAEESDLLGSGYGLIAVKLLDLEGGDQLISAFKALVKERPEVLLKLLVLGDDSLRSRFSEQIQTEKLPITQPLTGSTEPRSTLLAQSSLLIFGASRPAMYDEDIFLALLFGVPMIAGKLGILEEQVIDHITGLTTEPNDPESIKEKIGTFFDDQKLRTGLSLSAKERYFRLYSKPRSLAQFQKLL